MGHFKNQASLSLVLAVLCFVFYGNTLGNDYAFDDSVVITENQFTQKGIAGIPEIFANDTFRGSYDNLSTIKRYRPLSLATFAVEQDLFGNSPAIRHFDNILVLVWLSLVLFALLRKVFGGDAGKVGPLDLPFIATLLFIAHPVHTEVIANIKGRDELLAMAGALSATLALLRYIDSGKRKHLVWGFLGFLLALFSKENAVTFLAIVPLTIYFHGKADKRKYVLSLLPMVIASALFLGVRALALRGPGVIPAADILTEPFAYATASERFATAFYAFGRYLRLLVFPHPLTIDYYPFHIQLATWKNAYVWLSLLSLAGATGYALWALRRRSVVSYGILFFLITFSIVSNLPFSIGTFMSERFLFAPSLGFVLVVAWLLSRKLPLANRPKAVVVLALSLACLVQTHRRNEVWKNDFTLFTTDAKTSDRSIKGNLAASVSLLMEAQKVGDGDLARGYRAGALDHAKKAVSLFETYLRPEQRKASPYGDAVVLLGDCYGANDMLDAALQTYRRIYASIANREHLSDVVDKAISKSDDLEFKLRNYADFARLDPDNFMFSYRLGYLYGREKNDLVMSTQYLRRAVDIRPNELLALEALSHALKLSKDFEQAALYLERAAALKPGDRSYVRKLLDLYRQTGNQAKEAELLERLGGME
jgi:protein O-mannosyl-transferase